MRPNHYENRTEVLRTSIPVKQNKKKGGHLLLATNQSKFQAYKCKTTAALRLQRIQASKDCSQHQQVNLQKFAHKPPTRSFPSFYQLITLNLVDSLSHSMHQSYRLSLQLKGQCFQMCNIKDGFRSFWLILRSNIESTDNGNISFMRADQMVEFDTQEQDWGLQLLY